MKSELEKSKKIYLTKKQKEAILILFGNTSLEIIYKWIEKSDCDKILKKPEIKKLWIRIFPSTDRKETLEYLNKIMRVKKNIIPDLEEDIIEENAYSDKGIFFLYLKKDGTPTVTRLD